MAPSSVASPVYRPAPAVYYSRASAPLRVSYPLAAAGLIGVSVLLNLAYLLFACPFDLAPDEAHYWHWSRHLGWSYYSKGPLVAWVIRASCELFGDTPFAVRFPAVVCHAVFLTGLYRLAADALRSPRLGFLSVAFALTLPPITAGAVLMTIDAPFLACWCWALVCAWRALETGRVGWWLAAGAWTAVGVLAKYPMLLLPAAVGLFLLADRGRRRHLRQRGFWLMLAVTAAGCVPVVVWNAANDWVGLRHVLGQTGLADRPGVRWLGPLAFAGGQAAFLVGYWLAAFAAAAWAFRPVRVFPSPLAGEGGESSSRVRGRDSLPLGMAVTGRGVEVDPSPPPLSRKGRGEQGLAFLWFASVPVWGVFLLASFRTAGQLNWPAAAYVAGLPLAVAWVARQLESPNQGYRLFATVALAVAVVVGLVLSAGAHFPDLTRPVLAAAAGEPTDRDPLPLRRVDPTCRLQGWRTLAAAVDDARRHVRHKMGRDAVVAAMAWTVPGELAFYCDGRPDTFSLGRALGDRHSQYDLWRPNPIADAQVFVGRSFVYVGDEIPNMSQVFDRVEPPVRVTHHDVGGRPVAVWTVWAAHGFRGPPTLPPAGY